MLNYRKLIFCSFILKSIFAVVGIHIMVQEDKRDEKKKAKILVSNYISHLDHMIIDFIQPCHTVSISIVDKSICLKN